MTTNSVHLNGVIPTPLLPARPRSSGRMWPVFIVGLLSMNASIVAVTVYLAVRDKSVATEPDYYAKALAYNDTIQLRESSAKLGWKAEPTFRPGADGRSIDLVVTLIDRDGNPIEGATVSAIAFASARSGDRQSLSLTHREGAGGLYASPVRITRAGVWRVRLLARRGDDKFAYETDVFIPGPTA